MPVAGAGAPVAGAPLGAGLPEGAGALPPQPKQLASSIPVISNNPIRLMLFILKNLLFFLRTVFIRHFP